MKKGQLLAVLVGDPGLVQCSLQPLRIRPGVLAPAHASPLPDIEKQCYVGGPERSEKRFEVGLVDADAVVKADARIARIAVRTARSPGGA